MELRLEGGILATPAARAFMVAIAFSGNGMAMRGTRTTLTQPQRLTAAAIDLLIVVAACWFLFGTAYPPVGDKGFWAYSALLAVLVGSQFVTPFYVKPADAIAYAVPALISLALINEWSRWSINQKWVFSLAIAFALIVLMLAIANIVANSLSGERSLLLDSQGVERPMRPFRALAHQRLRFQRFGRYTSEDDTFHRLGCLQNNRGGS